MFPTAMIRLFTLPPIQLFVGSCCARAVCYASRPVGILPATRIPIYHSGRHPVPDNDVAVLIESAECNTPVAAMAFAVLLALVWGSLTLRSSLALHLRAREHLPPVPRSETAQNDALFFDVSPWT